jgi:hypothetical protein
MDEKFRSLLGDGRKKEREKFYVTRDKGEGQSEGYERSLIRIEMGPLFSSMYKAMIKISSN